VLTLPRGAFRGSLAQPLVLKDAEEPGWGSARGWACQPGSFGIRVPFRRPTVL